MAVIVALIRLPALTSAGSVGCILDTGVSIGACAEESELVRRLRAGEQEAFTDLIFRYRRRILNFAFRLLGDSHAAEDIAQETLLRAFHSIAGLRSESSLWPWLRRIALNLCLAERARSQRISSPFDEPIASEMSPDSLATNRIAVHAALAALSTPLRVVVVLRELEGLSYAEIANHLGIPIGTVRSRLAEARHKLREMLQSE